MSKGIDYSKWDNIGDDDSSDDEEAMVRGAPRVTQLDAPSRITTTNDGTVYVEKNASKTTKTADISQLQIEDNKEPSSQAIQSSSQKKPTPIPDSWTTNGGIVNDASYKMHWCQDRHVVWLRFLIPADVPSKDLTVEWTGKVYTYADRHTAVGSNNTASIRVRQQSTDKLLIEGDLPHPVHYTEDEEAEDLGWEIDRDGNNDQRYLLLTLPKATPMHGMTMQWKKPLQQVAAVTTETGSKSSDFQQAWDEAHTMFREKMARGEIPRRPDGLP